MEEILYKHSIFCFDENRSVFLWKGDDLLLTTCPTNPAHTVDPGVARIVDRLHPAESLFKHRIFCTTEAADVDRWKPETALLASCPNDPAHLVAAATARIIDHRDQKGTALVVKEPAAAQTGRNPRVECAVFVVAASAGVTIDRSWPFPVSISTCRAAVKAENVQDLLSISVGDGQALGQISADVNIGATVVNVTAASLQRAEIGHFLVLAVAGVFTEMGRIVGKNAQAATLTLETPSPAAFSAAAPTDVIVVARMLSSVELGCEGLITVGDDRSTSLSVPAGVVVRTTYTNVAPVAKRFVLYYHFDY